jgi:hypothetical protein
MRNIFNEKKMAFFPDRLKIWSTVHQRILKNKMLMPVPMSNPHVIGQRPYNRDKRTIRAENKSEVL